MVNEKYKKMIEELKEAGEYKRPVLAGELIRKGIQKGVTARVAPSYRKKDVATVGVVRKAVYLTSPKGSLVRAITKPAKKKGDRGRGRPRQTYKVRVLPSGKVVKVPTHIYKKMLAAEKTQMRLVRAQQMAQVQMQAEQVAMQQDPRYQPSAEDQFLAEPDQLHEMELARARQMAEMEAMEEAVPQRPSVGGRIIRGVRSLGRDEYSTREFRQPPSIQRPIIQSFKRPQPRGMGVRGEPRVTAISGKASLLNVSNNFDNKNIEQSMLTPHREINFFSNKQPIRIPNRSKSLKLMESQRGRR